MSSQDGPKDGIAIAFLGCGNLATAILRGILDSPSESWKDLPFPTPTSFHAIVTRPESKDRVLKECPNSEERLKVWIGENSKAVSEVHVVVLGCKPYMIKTVLGADGMRDALEGKLLVSLCAGVTVSQLAQTLMVESDPDHMRIIRVMPNTPSSVGSGMTIIAQAVPGEPEIKKEDFELVNWMFQQVGTTTSLAPHLLDASTALCGSGPAFFSLVLEAAIDGAVAMGIPAAQARAMAAQTMKGTAELVLKGEHPAILREKVSSPGGCTIGGLLVLEEGCVRGTVAKAVRQATIVASELGSGKKNVNGPR